MNKFETKEELRKEIASRFLANTRKSHIIKVRPGDFQNIGWCHFNVRQALETGMADYGAEVIQVTKKGLIRYHFIEAYKERWDKFTYTDNTLGFLTKEMTYYLVKRFTIKSVAGKDMVDVMNKAKTRFLKTLFTSKEIKELNIEYGDL